MAAADTAAGQTPEGTIRFQSQCGKCGKPLPYEPAPGDLYECPFCQQVQQFQRSAEDAVTRLVRDHEGPFDCESLLKREEAVTHGRIRGFLTGIGCIIPLSVVLAALALVLCWWFPLAGVILSIVILLTGLAVPCLFLRKGMLRGQCPYCGNVVDVIGSKWGKPVYEERCPECKNMIVVYKRRFLTKGEAAFVTR